MDHNKISYKKLYFYSFYKIVVYIGSITNQESNHLPNDSQYGVLTTTLNTVVVNKGEKLYIKSVVIIEGSTLQVLVFLFSC